MRPTSQLHPTCRADDFPGGIQGTLVFTRTLRPHSRCPLSFRAYEISVKGQTQGHFPTQLAVASLCKWRPLQLCRGASSDQGYCCLFWVTVLPCLPTRRLTSESGVLASPPWHALPGCWWLTFEVFMWDVWTGCSHAREHVKGS